MTIKKKSTTRAHKVVQKNKSANLIIAILISAAFVTTGLVYLGYQISKSGDISEQIQVGIQDYIKNQQDQVAKQATVPSAPVDVSEDDDAVKGNADAPVTIIEFSDYECPFCKRFYSQTLPEITSKYIDTGKVKIVYRDFPLGFHKNAIPAAAAAECVRKQKGDKGYFAMHDKIFSEQAPLNKENLIVWAGELGVDIESCIDDADIANEIQADFLAGQKVGVRGTPAFFINGRMLSGAQPFSAFESVIEEELKK